MLKAPELATEVSRLAALVKYKILDSDPEISYDDLTLLASQICGTPISLVSLVDEHRQWFKSKHGLGATETPRDISFCGHAIAQTGVFIVEDSAKDARFVDNPLAVGGPLVRFYAGAPLITPNGSAIGTLCVIDHCPRILTPSQIFALQALSRQVVALLELRQSKARLETELSALKLASQKVVDQQLLLSNATRLESMAEMAANLAHEMNNPLAIISANCQRVATLVGRDQSHGEKILKSNATIEKTVGRIVEITRALGDFSQRSLSSTTQIIDFRKSLLSILQNFNEEFEIHSIRFELDCLDAFLKCEEYAFSQMIKILITNAVEAASKFPDRFIRMICTVAKAEIVVTIQNSGPKIPPEHWDRLMTPFFTTKTVGKGVGLGLSTALGIAHANGGELYFDRAEAITTFILKLPLAAQSSLTGAKCA